MAPLQYLCVTLTLSILTITQRHGVVASVFARIEKGQGADLWKGHFLCAVYNFEGTFMRDFTF